MVDELDEIEINHEAYLGYSSATKTAYKIGKNEPKPTSTQPDDESEIWDLDVAYWGKNNDFPQEVEKAIESNPDLANVLQWKAIKLYSGGVTYKVMEEDDDGNAVYKDKVIPEIETWLKRNRHFPLKACMELYRYYNIFPELVKSLDGSKINYIDCKLTKECRYTVMDKNLGYSRYVILNPNWHLYSNKLDKKAIPVPVINPMYWTPEMVKEIFQGDRFIYPVSFPTGKKYYQLATWHSLIVSKWLDLANSIPKFKTALLKNQVTIKYHVQMPDYWMTWKYPKFDTYSPEKKKELTEKEVKKFDDFLKGVEKAGKSMTSVFKTDKHTLKPYPGWVITPIDDKIKDGIYIEDSHEATTKIYSAVGVDPALGGFTPGKSGTNRNGSDKREAANEFYTSNYVFEELIMQIYDFVADFNGWNEKYGYLVWGFIKSYQQTLNKVTPNEREATSNDPIQD